MSQLTKPEREEVASFAGWCIGSAMGDFHPGVDRERRKVLNDDHVFSIWRDRMTKFEADQRKHLPTGVCCAEPVNDKLVQPADDDLPFRG